MGNRVPTKQKILNVLKKHDNSSMKEIMNFFTISEVAVRRHVHELEQQGFIKSQSVQQKIGRPYYLYSLTKEGHETFPNKHDKLPVELLQDLEDVYGEQAVEAVLAKRMAREEAHYKSQIKVNDLDQKVTEVARIQEDKGYMVESKKITEGQYEIRNYNCPIINLASEYKQVCKNEKTVLSNIFSESEVISYSRITQGDSYCKWIIKATSELPQSSRKG